MILIEKVKTMGWDGALRGMRNPKDSWEKADSIYGVYFGKDDNGREMIVPYEAPEIGENDLKLATTLANAGQVHGKYLRMIHVQMDITAPLYWWKEMDTYKVGTTADSCSTMHRIHAKEFTPDQFSHEHLIGEGWSEADNFRDVLPRDILNQTIVMLNCCREKYLYSVKAGDHARAKMFWWQMIQLLPSSYNQKRTWDADYAVLKNIYEYRKDHKLDEWHEFCHMIEALPYADELIIGGKK